MTPLVFVVALAAFLGVLAGLRPLVRYLKARALLDYPNARGSHTAPTPRGAGLILIPAVIASWLLASLLGAPGPSPATIAIVGGAALGLAALSWVDDLRDLPVWLRLLAQFIVVAVGLLTFPDASSLFGDLLPRPLATLVVALIWVWFINLFNFMDGIDGISALETIVLAAGVVALATVTSAAADMVPPAVLVAAVALGFLPWNWHPARIFLGDVGSAPLGFLLGWMLLSLAFAGQWAAALILPAYYLADATVTLGRRTLRGEKVWRPHRDHFYQRAAAASLGHRAMAGLVAGTGAVLVGLAVLAGAGFPGAALLAAASLVAGVLVRLERVAGKTGSGQRS